jgi:cyclohexanone monooxygenase
LLAPKDYPYGTKRPPIDTDCYKTFNRTNVTLVDLRQTPIVEATTTGLRTTDADYEVDIIVFATGFDAMTGSLLKMDIRGRDAQTLREKWAGGPVSFLGLFIAGFPNMFTITGPGSPSVLANMPIAIEQHVDWIADCISYMRERGLTTVETTEASEQRWVEHVRAVADSTLFPLANSWYLGANIEGKQRVFMPYVGGLGRYRERCDRVAADGYPGLTMA